MNMDSEKISTLVLKMALPMVLGMLVNSIYNIVDSYFVAKISEDAMVSLSLVYPLQNMMSAIAIGFGIGANAVVSFCLGAKDQDGANRASGLSLILACIQGLLYSFIAIAILPGYLQGYTNSAIQLEYGNIYGNIVFSFSIVVSSMLIFEKLFQATGKMKISMIAMLSGCIANIILDPLMIFGIGFPAMGIQGAAIATGLGQVITLGVYLFFYVRGDMQLKLSFRRTEKDLYYAKRIYGTGIPAILNLALPSLQIGLLNRILTNVTSNGVLILGIYYKLQTFIYLTANGIIQGIRPLVGYNYGAGHLQRVKDIMHFALMLCVGVMSVGTILCMFMPDTLMGLFTTDAVTISAGASALRRISLGFIVSALSVAISGTMEGLGKGTQSFVISLLRYLLVLIPVAYIGAQMIGANGVWYAFPITELITAVVSYFIYTVTLQHIEVQLEKQFS